MHKKIALASLVIILILINWSIVGKERHLAEGKLVYLELRPVDPRSLMQGDYMALRFRMADKVRNALPKITADKNRRYKLAASDGFLIASLDARHVGTFKRLDDGQVLTNNEVRMRYRVRNGAVKFSTNAYFFQEGDAKYYEPAKYGAFRVDEAGELLLTAMYDRDLKKLKPDATQ